MIETTIPSRLLLATDMSARCDRALARAALLARELQGELVVLHAIHPSQVTRRDRLSHRTPSWRRPESWTVNVERRLRADLVAENIAATARVVQGLPAEAVLEAADEGASLIVLGIAKDARMDRIQLGSTVDALVSRARVPVLNVRSRAHGPYRNVVVATDFSDPSAHALRLAARWFAGARLTLFHAFMTPDSLVSGGPTADDALRSSVSAQCDAFVAQAGLPEQSRGSLQWLVEEGPTDALLCDYVAATDVDLVVLGSHGRSGFLQTMLGSTAKNLLHALDCDTLVVRVA